MNKLRLAAAIVALIGASALPAQARSPAEIRTQDVTLFYEVYDAAGGTPTGSALQRDYIDAGSDGLRQFIPDRIISGDALAEVIKANRPVYDQARACMAVLPEVDRDLQAALHKLSLLDPQAAFPPVTILIGRNNSGGTTGRSGVLIGLEVACRSSWLQADLSKRLLHLIAHEYGHVVQSPLLDDESAQTTVLRQSLIEGVAELVAELISGEISNVHLAQWTKGRVREIDERFLADADNPDISGWLYDGVGTPENPGDLGYWEGYRIARSFYARAHDKQAALRTLLDLKDPKAILKGSGWTPGQE